MKKIKERNLKEQRLIIESKIKERNALNQLRREKVAKLINKKIVRVHEIKQQIKPERFVNELD